MSYIRKNLTATDYTSLDTFNFTDIDNRIAFANSNCMNLRWHVAVYHPSYQLPQLIKDMDANKTLNSNIMSNFLSNHISNNIFYFGFCTFTQNDY